MLDEAGVSLEQNEGCIMIPRTILIEKYDDLRRVLLTTTATANGETYFPGDYLWAAIILFLAKCEDDELFNKYDESSAPRRDVPTHLVFG